MRKIPTLFLRDPDNMRYVLREVHPDCTWVVEGEGVPTVKYDGTCVMLGDDERWYARREVKKGKPTPPDFAQVQHDPETGKTVGWIPIEQSPFYTHFQDAQRLDLGQGLHLPGKTFELVGPKINGNPDGFNHHMLIGHGHTWARHDNEEVKTAPRDYDGLRDWLHSHPYEGVVWHWYDSDDVLHMAKIKGRDFPKDPKS